MSRIREGTVIADKYRLERPLARGGMGAIWIARHLPLDMLVAVKFMDADFAATAEGRSRFEREARAVALIQSPNIIHVHDYGVHEDTPYMAMELLRGEDLGARIRREKQLRLPFMADVVSQVGKALRKAHEAGIIHRDLKPANVYLAKDDEEQVVKVLDFGVAKLIGVGEAGESTRTGVVIGSVHYMSPEQARGLKDIDHRSDLWSLGVIIFRALTGQLPFPGDQMGDVIVKICSEPLPVASSFRADLPPEIDAFFVKAFARKPAERFQSARELAQAFAVAAGARVDSTTSSGARVVPAVDVATDPHGSAPRVLSPAPAHGEPLATPHTGRSLATPPVAPIFPPPPSVGTLTRASVSDVVEPPPRMSRAKAALIAAAAALAVIGGVILSLRGGGTSAASGAASAPDATASAARLTPPAASAAAVPSSAPMSTTSATVAASASAPASATPTVAPAKTAAPRAPQKKINAELGF